MPKKILTEDEIIERDLYIETELVDGKAGVKAVAKHNRHNKQQLKEIDKLCKKIEKGETKTMKHGIEVDVTEADFVNVVRLDRSWTKENLEGVFAGTVNRLDLSEINPVGVE